MKPEIYFQKETHTYTVNGKRFPSVTQIIKQGGGLDTTFCTEYGRQRGTAIHECVQLINEGDLDEASVDPLIAPWVDAYRAFLGDSAFRVYRCEECVASLMYGFAGQFDIYGLLRNKRAIIDVKTGAVPDAVEWQLGGYMQAARECGLRVQTAYSLQLRADGTYRLKQHQNGFIGFRQFLANMNRENENNG